MMTIYDFETIFIPTAFQSRRTTLTHINQSSMYVLDWISMFANKLVDIHYHSKHRAFRFTKSSAGHCVFQYKESLLDEVWLGNDGLPDHQISIFKPGCDPLDNPISDYIPIDLPLTPIPKRYSAT